MAYPSALSLVRICSESTRAFGHPSETNPTFGAAAATRGRGWILAMAMGGNRAVRKKAALQCGCCGAFERQRFFSSSGDGCAPAAKLGKGKEVNKPRV